MSAHSMGEMGKDFCPNFLQLSLKMLTGGTVTPESYSSITQPSSKMLTLSFGGGSHLGVPRRSSFLGRVELEGRKAGSDQYPKGP